MLKPALIFQSHMLLQRDKEIRIWGSADAGSEIDVRIQGKSWRGRAGEDGSWCVKIGPLAASFGEEMEIISGAERVCLEDVQVGEVWLAAGQSNMEFHMRFDADFEAVKPDCEDDALRFF